MEDFKEFMKERARSCERHSSNCVGSALYITGEISFDSYFSRRNAKLKLSRLKTAYSPEVGYIALWQWEGEPVHAGVIFEKNPFKIVHRSEANGLLTEKLLDEFIEHTFKFTGIKPVYKIPNKLRDPNFK